MSLESLDMKKFTRVLICEVCHLEFSDIGTPYFFRKTCSNVCRRILQAQTGHERGIYERTPEMCERISNTLKEQNAEGSGYVATCIEKYGVRNYFQTEECKEKSRTTCQKKYGVNNWVETDIARMKTIETNIKRNVSFDTRKKMSDSAIERMKKHPIRSRGKAGYREDLGDFYFRSSWEANFVRVLNKQKISWQYEPIVFDCGNNISYIPDFKIDEMFFEVKGWFDKRSKMKIEAFKRAFPNIVLVIVDKHVYRILEKTYANSLPFWEKRNNKI